MGLSFSRRRIGGKLAALAAGSALFFAPVVSTAAPLEAGSQNLFGTAPLAASAPASAGPVAGFEDNAARAVYWILNEVESNGWTLDLAIAVAGAGYGEAVREDVLEWARADGLAAAGNNDAYLGKLAQIIGIYGENPATFIPGTDIEEQLRQVVASGSSNSIYTLPFIVWGLAYTDDGVPESAVNYLVGEQCSNGLFGWGCNDTDTSGWVIQALLAAGVDPQDDVIQDALEGFASYKTETGGYVTNGQSVANTNSSAIVAQVLRAVGDTTGADEALAYIGDLQIGWVGTDVAQVGQIAQHQSQFDDLIAGNPAGSGSVTKVISQVPAAFGPNAFGSIAADGSVSERPEIPLVFPESYGQTTDEDALLVAHWLQEEIAATDGLMPNFGAPDWGITLDSLVSLAALGTGTDAADMALTRFASEGETFLDKGLSQTAKAAYTLLVYGEDPRAFFDGRDLLEELREGIEDDGALGEFADTLGQSFALLAFERTAQGSPDSAVEWLEEQQCVDTTHENYGGYEWGGAGACNFVDADTTGLVVQALTAADVDSESESIAAGLEWLAANLNDDGASETWGEASANSTTWAAQALATFGLSQAVDARSFLKNQIIQPSEVDKFKALSEADAGLVPSSPDDRSLALVEGTKDIMAGARFATAQAGVGLGGYSMAEITALGARTAAPAPKFAGGGTNPNPPLHSGEDDGSDNDDGDAAQPQKFQPKYTG